MKHVSRRANQPRRVDELQHAGAGASARVAAEGAGPRPGKRRSLRQFDMRRPRDGSKNANGPTLAQQLPMRGRSGLGKARLVPPNGGGTVAHTGSEGMQMDEQVFQTRLAELVAEIGTLPADEKAKLELMAQETKERHEKLKQ